MLRMGASGRSSVILPQIPADASILKSFVHRGCLANASAFGWTGWESMRRYDPRKRRVHGESG